MGKVLILLFAPIKRTGFMPVLLILLSLTGQSQAFAYDSAPSIAIIIDDMGKKIRNNERVLNLPGPVACAFLPHAKYTRELAEQAFHNEKEVLMHLPMQSIYSWDLDVGAITLEMSEEEVTQIVEGNLLAVPYASGVNNHMGSMLTQHPGHMSWVMDALQSNGDLFFIDSRTTAKSIAWQVAQESGIRTSRRNVFLDHQINASEINEQFDHLIEMAYKNGTAIAIGHPYPRTLTMLEKRLPELEALGIELVPIAQIIEMQQEATRWQASLSLSHQVVKNLKQ